MASEIVERNEYVKIFGEKLKLNAEVKTLNAFSAHADYNEILDYISQLETATLKKVFLIHGGPDVQENLKSLLIK